MRRVREGQRRLRQTAGTLDPDVLRAVDHDLGHGWVRQQALERAVAEDVVGDLGTEALPVVAREAGLLRELVSDLGLDAATNRPAVLHFEQAWAELADEREVDPVLEFREGVAPVAVRRGDCRRYRRSRYALVQLHR